MPKFDAIQLFGFGPGVLSLNHRDMKWTSRDGSEMQHRPLAQAESAQWTMYGRRGLLRLLWRDGTATRLEGFAGEDLPTLQELFRKADGDSELAVTTVGVNVAGTNFGEVAFEGKRLLFERDGTLVFEKDLTSMTQCVIPGNRAGNNEVEMQFLESDAVATADDTLVEIRFVMPEADEDAAETPAEQMQKLAVEAAGLRSTGGASICDFEDLGFLVPRGHYSLHMFDTFVRMNGPKYDYRIKYEDINRLYMLEKPDGYRMVVVISLTRGIRQGQQRYQNLVLETNKDEDDLIIKLTDDECQDRFHGELLPTTTGPVCNLLAMAFRHIAGKKIFVAGSYRSARDLQCIQCAYKASNGLLFMLDRSFVFIHKPTIIVRFGELQSVELLKGDAKLGLRTFDMVLTLKGGGSGGGDILNFSQLEKDEYRPLLNFLQKQKVRIKNLRDDDEDPNYAEVDDNDAAGPALPLALDDGLDEDESEDEDFNPDEKRSDEEDVSDSDDDADGDDGFEDEDEAEARPKKVKAASPSPKMKKKKKKQPRAERPAEDEDGESDSAAASPTAKKAAKKKAKRKRKDPNAPKRAQTAYFAFMAAKRDEVRAAHPEWKLAETSKELGRLWGELDDAAKAPYNAQAEQDKKRYESEMATYEPPEPEDDSDGDSADDTERARPAKKRKKKVKKDPNAPKRGLTAFFIFSGEERANVKAAHPEFSTGDMGKELGRLWREMTPEQKAPYEDKSKADKERYERERAAYDESQSQRQAAGPAKGAKLKDDEDDRDQSDAIDED